MLRSIKFDSAVELGIKEQFAALGDHVAYFWETHKEFCDAVGFLEVGLRNGDHCVIFGFDEANSRVLAELLSRDFDSKALEKDGRLTILTGADSGEEMLTRIAADFQQAIAGGARMIRLLGNIGWGRDRWPHDRDILEFEARVTAAVADLPAVVVCMYDVHTLRGDILLQGAFETHPLTIRRNLLRENEHYVPLQDFLRQLKESS
jgi:hypothetical protein